MSVWLTNWWRVLIIEHMTPLVITNVVASDLCIGCGVCVAACPSQALDVSWNETGFLTAQVIGNACEGDGACIKVCPFNPKPEDKFENEDKLSDLYLHEASHSHRKIGRYTGLYAGYSVRHRATSSSGGIATYIYERLFVSGMIDHVVTVGESTAKNAHFEYCIISDKADLLSTSKTKYYPVTLSKVIKDIKKIDGNVAISGVACFIKAIRLAQAHDPVLKDKITFLTGIICGGVKSRFFTEYLASRTGIDRRIKDPQYRVKDPDSTASDYGFSCQDEATNQIHFIKMRTVGDMWGTGMFKANACDFCDDVTTELADISLGDAWLDPYSRDGQGHNVVVTRSPLANEIIQQGFASGELVLEDLTLERFIASQQGSFNHRHDGLAFRTSLESSAGVIVPPKRHPSIQLPISLRLVQLARRTTRKKSIEAWQKHRNSILFDREMKLALLRLKLLTKASHGVRKLKKLVGSIK